MFWGAILVAGGNASRKTDKIERWITTLNGKDNKVKNRCTKLKCTPWMSLKNLLVIGKT